MAEGEGEGGDGEEGGVRLTPDEVIAIRASANEAFGPSAVVRLFGSRLDDGRRGGDIDLHVSLVAEQSAEASGRFRSLLGRRVGDREYDIIIHVAGREPTPIDRKALAEGQVL